MIKLAGLDLMQGDDDALEELSVLISKWYSKPTDDGSVNVEELWNAIELVPFVDENVEVVIHTPTDHLSSRDQLGVEPVQDILKILPLSWLLRVKKLQEHFNELMCDVLLQRLDITDIVQNQLIKQLVNGL